MKRVLLKALPVVFALITGCAGPSASVATPASYKTVSFNALMGGKTPGVAATATIPANYVSAGNLGDASTYWMDAAEIEMVARTKDLPSGSGYLNAKISTNEAYRNGRFLVENNFDSQLKSAGLELLHKERLQVGGRPDLAYAVKVKRSGKFVGSLFVATGKGDQVAFVGYRPPGNSWLQGQSVWSAFVSSLK
jgi:hypothetical protein